MPGNAPSKRLEDSRGFLRNVLGEEIKTLRGVKRECRGCRKRYAGRCGEGIKVRDESTGELVDPPDDYHCVLWE
jgi:hypothetical protein